MKRTAIVTQYVEVEIDEAKFTPEFMEEFRKSFYNFRTIEEYIEHLAQMVARGVYSEHAEFIEGYGPPDEMGIKVKILDNETESEIQTGGTKKP
jgi:hypothetical protein